jgi:type VI protein secretion system component VasF
MRSRSTSYGADTKEPQKILEEISEERSAEEQDDHFLPPRKTVHPAERERWVRYFYRTLLWLFVLLVLGLLVWGWQLVRE